jgi:hypothetical protein
MMECGILAGRQRLHDILLEPVLRAEEAVHRQESDRRLKRRELLHDWTDGAPPEPPAGRNCCGNARPGGV